METFTLMRHAKSSWADTSQSDHDRPLNRRGNTDAPDMARRLLRRDSIPQTILCSSARRTRETVTHVLNILGTPAPQVHYLDSLYLASAAALLAALESAAGSGHILLVAHNPGIEDLSAQLQGLDEDIMPTAAVRQFQCLSIEGLSGRIFPAGANVANSAPEGVKLVYSDYPKNTAQDL